jgi:hypothetical protein
MMATSSRLNAGSMTENPTGESLRDFFELAEDICDRVGSRVTIAWATNTT